MDNTRRQPYFRTVILVSAVYALIGIVFAMPAGHVRAWRLAAWLVKGVVYAFHLGFERFRLRSSSFSTALHVAWAAAFGALWLAVRAVVHTLSASGASQHRRLMLVALVVWPLITSVPAFLVGLGASNLLGLWLRRGHVESRG